MLWISRDERARQGHTTTQNNGGYSQNGAGRGLRNTFVHVCMLDVWLVACGHEKRTFRELLFAPFA